MSGFLDIHDGLASLDLAGVLLGLLSAFLLSQVIAWTYIRTHQGVSYSGSLARSLVVLAMIVALVMMVVGDSLARAFGLFGALALIRFRTPVKNASDTVYLFLAVAVGIAIGTGRLVAGVTGTGVICLVQLYLSAIGFGTRLEHDGLIRLCLPPGLDAEARVRTILERYCAAVDLLHAREAEPGQSVEFSYQVRMKDPSFGPRLMAELEDCRGVSHLSLLMQESEAMP